MPETILQDVPMTKNAKLQKRPLEGPQNGMKTFLNLMDLNGDTATWLSYTDGLFDMQFYNSLSVTAWAGWF